MKTLLRRADVLEYYRQHGLSRRVFQQMLLDGRITKLYIPPLKAGESPDNRRAFYSAGQVARAAGLNLTTSDPGGPSR